MSFAKTAGERKGDRLCTPSSEAHRSVALGQLYSWKPRIAFLIQVISILHRISCQSVFVHKSYLLDTRVILKNIWNPVSVAFMAFSSFLLSWVWCTPQEHFPVHTSLKCMLCCPMFHFAQSVALALILVTPCSDDSVRYYSKCGSGRTKLGARVVLFLLAMLLAARQTSMESFHS